MKEVLSIPGDRDGFAIAPGPVPMVRPHRHDELEVNVVLRGSAAYLLYDRRYDLRPNMLIWLFPGQEHRFLDCSTDYRAWIVVFNRRLLANCCRSTPNLGLLETNPPGSYCKFISPEKAHALDLLFTELAQSPNSDLFNAGLAYGLLSAWEVFQSADSTAHGTVIHPGVERAIRLLQDETESITVNSLARQVGLSTAHLSRLFGQQTGLSVTDFRNKQRLERFLRALRPDFRQNLAQLALDSGFGSYAQFYAIFLKQMGQSPEKYRKSLKRA